MQFKLSNRDSADVVFVNARNITGATVSAGAAVEWDVETVSDGNAVTQAKSGSLAGLFAGVNDAALADSSYGLVQVYGFRTSAHYSGHSGTASAPGTFLQPVSGYFEPMSLSAAGTSGHRFVSLMETIAAAAGATALQQVKVFIRAM